MPKKKDRLPPRPPLHLRVEVHSPYGHYRRREVLKALVAYLAGFEHQRNGPLSAELMADFTRQWMARKGFTRFLRSWDVKLKLVSEHYQFVTRIDVVPRKDHEHA